VNDSTVLLATNLAWPIAVLIITIMLLITQRKPIGNLISRIVKVSYPGGTAELGSGIPEQAAQTFASLADTLAREPAELISSDGVSVEQDPAGSTDLTPNREPLGEFRPPPSDEVDDLVSLGLRVRNLLSELAQPPPIDGIQSVYALIDVLRNRAMLDTEQAQAFRDMFGLVDRAIGGAEIPPKVANAAANTSRAILDQLAIRVPAAPKRFEDNVLEVLQVRLPAGWQVVIDAAVPRPQTMGPVSTDKPNLLANLHVRVDALVTAHDRQAVVEVRARLEPSSPGQVRAVEGLLIELPPDLPVLLVVLGEGLSGRQLRELRQLRPGPVELLQWDRDSTELISTLRDLLLGQQGWVQTRTLAGR
jgi:hypothetical protein